MKEQIYTIDINAAFDEHDSCPLCTLMVKYENELYEYILGAAMMEPDTRIQTNQKGFCHSHLQGLFERKNKLSFGLMLESLLMEINRKPDKEIARHSHTCYLCDRKESYEKQLVSNVALLWKREPEFARKWDTIQGFCLPHANLLADNAVRELGKKQGPEFAKAAFKASARRAAALQPLISAFCQSFDHRNAGLDIGEAKNAVELACQWLGGRRG